MEQRYLIVIDEQSQAERLIRLKGNLKKECMDLVYEEIDPTECTSRGDNGDLSFDKDILKNKLSAIPYLAHVDVFATDYNLIDMELKGIDVIKLFYECVPYFNKRVVLYSAQIEDVINDILKSRRFAEQIEFLKLMSKNEIQYLSSEGEFESKFKGLIVKQPELTIDSRLSDALLSINRKDFICTIPEYQDCTMEEVGKMLCQNGNDKLKKEIVDHIVAYITAIQGYE